MLLESKQCFFTLALVRSPAGGSIPLLRVERNMWFRWLAGRGVSELNGLSSRGLNLMHVRYDSWIAF